MTQYMTSWGYRPGQAGATRGWPERAVLWVHLHWRSLLVLLCCVGIAGGSLAWRRRTAEAREAAAAAQLFRASQSPEQAEEMLTGVMVSFPKTAAARMARFTLAGLALSRQEWRRAVELLTPLADAGPTVGGIEALAIALQAAAYEEGKDFVAAADAFQRLLRMQGKTTGDRAEALRGAVRCLVAAGLADAARTLLETTAIEGEGSASRETDLLWIGHVARQSGSSWWAR